MRLTQCDRCGEVKEKYGVFEGARVEFYQKSPAGGHDQVFVDICPKCIDAFHQWLAVNLESVKR